MQGEAGLRKSLIDSGIYIFLIRMEIFLTGKERPWEEGWLVMREEITKVEFLCFLT